MRSRTAAGALLLATGLMAVGVGLSHADTEVHNGAANDFGSQSTNYGSIGAAYAGQAATSVSVGGSFTQYSSATNAPSSNGSTGPGR